MSCGHHASFRATSRCIHLYVDCFNRRYTRNGSTVVDATWPCFLDPDTLTQRNTDIYWKRNPFVNNVLTIFPCRSNLIFIVKVECPVVPTRRYFLNAHSNLPPLSFSEWIRTFSFSLFISNSRKESWSRFLKGRDLNFWKISRDLKTPFLYKNLARNHVPLSPWCSANVSLSKRS